MRLTLLAVIMLLSPIASAAAQSADVQFLSNTVSTDLPLRESKEAIHWFRLTCRLADGGSGTLTLDASVPRFNEFGDPVEGGKPSPQVTLDCTLKLIKENKGRRIFEIRGPKIVTRFSLVVEKDIAPWGDGRLLIHGKDGEVRYVVDLAFAVAPAVAQPPEVQFLSDTFSTDLPLAESKERIHWLCLQCRLADGGSGSLTLDPSAPTFNEFGDPVAGGKPLPRVTLDCTLKLTKADKGRRVFEIRGSKIVTRLSLVVEKDLPPWGDGRLLIHGKDGGVRYVVDIWQPRAKPEPGVAGGQPRSYHEGKPEPR